MTHSWIFCLWLVSAPANDRMSTGRHSRPSSPFDSDERDNKMEQSTTSTTATTNGRRRRRVDDERRCLWPSLPAESRLASKVKGPHWLRSLSLHRHPSRLLVDKKSVFVLPKLASPNGLFHRLDDECVPVGSENNNNNNNHDGSNHRIVLPPLSVGTASPIDGPVHSDKSTAVSWLLPAVSRQEVYRQVREQRQLLSAKVARLPPLVTTSPPPSSSTGSTGSSGTYHALSSSAPPPRSPRGVEGTSVMLLSNRSVSRCATRTSSNQKEEHEQQQRQQVEDEEEDEEEEEEVQEQVEDENREEKEEEEEEEEEEEVKRRTTSCAQHPNERAAHLWTYDSGCTSNNSPVSDVFNQQQEREQEPEEEIEEVEIEENDEEEEGRKGRKGRIEKVALVRDALSGHRAPVDESRTTGRSAVLHDRQSRDAQSTLTAVQWTIEWTPRVVVPLPPRHYSSDADEIEEEMAAPWTVERQWRSAKVGHHSPRHPVNQSIPPASPSTTTVTMTSYRSTSPPVPALRAKTAHPSMSIELRQDDEDEDDDDDIDVDPTNQSANSVTSTTIDDIEIIQDIDLNLFDQQIDILSSSDIEDIENASARSTESSIFTRKSRLREEGEQVDDDGSFTKSLGGDQPLFGVPLEQLKKLLHATTPTSNNKTQHLQQQQQLEEDDDDDDDVEEDARKMTSSSPTFRRHPSEQLLSVVDYLPNAVHQHDDPDDRPIAPSKSPRVIHSPVEQRRRRHHHPLATTAQRPLVFDNDDYDYVDDRIDNIQDDNDQEDEDDDQMDDDTDNLRLPVKSRSLASFATSSSSPDDNSRRQRSLPIRRHDIVNEKTNGIKRTGLMPSSIVQRRQAGQSPQNVASKLSTGKLQATEQQPMDPRTALQVAMKNMNSSEWEVKMEGIRRLEDLITTNSDVVIGDIHVVVLALLVEIKNLRSQVSRAAIQSMGKMFQHCGRHMEQDLDRTVPLLLNKVGDTNRFIRDDAHAALMNVTEFVSSPKAIVVIVTESLTHKNATVRAEAAKLLAAIVTKMGPAKTLSGAKDVTERILPAAAHFLQDGSLEARAQAKKIFSQLMGDVVFEKAMHKYLSPTVIRNIQRTLDTIRKSR